MKLLLNSNGLENPKVAKEFLRLFDEPVDGKKVVFLYTKVGFKQRYLDEMVEHWTEIGFDESNLNFINISEGVEKIPEFDVVCVCGGNTFYILDLMRRLGLGEIIKDSVRGGAVYVGMSAGSVIAGPDIEIAGWSDDWDINDVEMEDFDGLGLTDRSVSPHYTDEDEDIVRSFERKRGKSVVRLRDGEALMVNGDYVGVLG